MLTVYAFGPALGLPDTSPFVIKLETWLRMAHVPYRSERGDLRKAPKKKLPYIADGSRLIADSSHIIEYLEEKHNDPLNEKRFSNKDRAYSQAIKSLFEMDLYFVGMYLRWWNDDDFEIMKPALVALIAAAGVPKFAVPAIAALARRDARSTIEAQGTGRHAREEVYAIGRTLVESASDLLGEKKFFLGEKPSKIDASAYGILAGVMADAFDNPVKACAKARQNLVDYCERIRVAYWTSP
jgi:glutathione S-transferase